MKELRVGSVPEHFTMPFHLAMKDGAFEAAGIRLQWKDFPGGTGAMTKALREDDVDICALLTEGGIADINRGNPSRLIGVYVVSPIMWGIFTGVNSPDFSREEIFKQKIAISRIGSGSHLIPQVDALMREKQIDKDQFVIVGDVKGGLEHLADRRADIFYWEKVTTQPYVEQGLVKRLGVFITPWPSFVLCSREEILREDPELIHSFQEVLYRYTRNFMSTEGFIPDIAARFSLSEHSIESWFHHTAWSDHAKVSPKMVSNVHFSLMRSGILEKTLAYEDIVWEPSQVT